MENNNLYPVFIKLNEIQTLIVGGGNVGLEKVTFILRQSPAAKIKVVSKEFHPQLIRIAIKNPNVKLAERAFEASDLNQVKLLILATNDTEVNNSIIPLADEKNILTNVVDQPSSCEFYTAAVTSRGPVKIAVSSNGSSPTLAKRLRDIFEASIPNDVELTTAQLNQIRNRIDGDLSVKIDRLNAITQVLLNEQTKQQTSNYQFPELILN